MRIIRATIFSIRLARALFRESKKQMPNATRKERLVVVTYCMNGYRAKIREMRLDQEALRQEYR